MTHARVFADPVLGALHATVFARRSRSPVVDEHRAVADETFVSNVYAGANERMALHFDTRADARAALNLDERTDERIVANRATVEVDPPNHLHTCTKLHVGRNLGKRGAGSR
jgi:hypothetical protein